jgi:hypothetical protein
MGRCVGPSEEVGVKDDRRGIEVAPAHFEVGTPRHGVD